MSELLERLRQRFQDEEYRYAYVEGFTNSFIAAQIKSNREARHKNQQQLADLIGTKQSGISRLESVQYSSWKVETLRKLARAFGLRLRISFEEFGTLLPEIEGFNETSLQRREFKDDPVFKGADQLPMVDLAVGAGASSAWQDYGLSGNTNAVTVVRKQPALESQNQGPRLLPRQPVCARDASGVM